MEWSLGADTFRRKFITITSDNGVEFSDFERIENSCIYPNKRTTLYFCHPFSSGERGSNENVNGLIRYWIPKGKDIGQYTKEQIQQIQDWINNYPRKKFDGMSTNEYKAFLGIS